jgi:hypothetical protein
MVATARQPAPSPGPPTLAASGKFCSAYPVRARAVAGLQQCPRAAGVLCTCLGAAVLVTSHLVAGSSSGQCGGGVAADDTSHAAGAQQVLAPPPGGLHRGPLGSLGRPAGRPASACPYKQRAPAQDPAQANGGAAPLMGEQP